jgi:hypothetical protein
MLNPSDLSSVRSWLCESERECVKHINAGTFDEKTFEEYFIHWDQYFYIISHFPVPDLYDAQLLPQIARYYNAHTYSSTRYNEKTGSRKR